MFLSGVFTLLNVTAPFMPLLNSSGSVGGVKLCGTSTPFARVLIVICSMFAFSSSTSTFGNVVSVFVPESLLVMLIISALALPRIIRKTKKARTGFIQPLL